MSQTHSFNVDIGPAEFAEAVDRVPFGTGRGHLDPGLGSPFPDADPIGTELLGSVEHGALRFSGRGVASPFVFDLPARNLVSAVLEAEFEDSLIFGGAPVGTSLRVSHAYVTRGSIRTACTGESTERVGCAARSWELVADFGSDRLTLTDSHSRDADGRVFGTGSVDSASGVSPYGLFTHLVDVTAGAPVAIRAVALGQVSAGSLAMVPGASFLDFNDSGIFWAGIQSVQFPDGSPVDHTLTSASGIDYRESLAPVPEPSTWASLLAGIGVLGALLRGRTKGRPLNDAWRHHFTAWRTPVLSA